MRKSMRTAATELTSSGLLQVNVVNMTNNFPIQNARVTISYSERPENTLEEVTTNSSGQTEQIALSAPPLEYSLEPGDIQPYSDYNLRISAPGFFADPAVRKAYCTAKWNGPARGMLDPEKEVKAAELRVANGFSTRSDETMQMTGTDFYSNVEQLKHEENELKEVKKIANSIDTERSAGRTTPDNAAGAANDPAAGQQDTGKPIRGNNK